jgi:hypothetical protein
MFAELPNKSLFRPDEVAFLLAKSTRTIYRMMERGALQGKYKGGKGPLWIPRDAVLALIAGETHERGKVA